MAVFLTNTMLSKFRTVIDNPPYTAPDVDEQYSEDPWKHISMNSKSSGYLARAMICRVCAKAGSTPLSEKIIGYDIMSAISRLTNVSISPEDSLPKYICNECMEMLRIALNFKTICEAADRKFRRLLNPMGDPMFHSYPYSKHDFQMILHQMKLKQMNVEKEKERLRQMEAEKNEQKNMPKVKQFKCSTCNMTFPNKEKLVAHRQERQCMKRACDVCGQLVLSIGQHMRHIHKQTVQHKCPTCGKEFPIIARLKNHMLVHTNTFNFFCDLCPYKCKHKYYLVMHMRTHTGEKPYKCTQCPATFVNPSNLNKHKLTHQEKQFKCGLCDKAFRTSTALREHHDATHMNIKHACSYCGQYFCYKSDLRKHEIRNHNRLKRGYIGGEPTYKQVERLQKIQDTSDPMEKWRTQEMTLPPPTQIVHTTYIEQNKEFLQSNHSMYFTDVTGIIQQPQMVQQQTVQLTLPELEMKKDEVKIYEAQQSIGYF